MAQEGSWAPTPLSPSANDHEPPGGEVNSQAQPVPCAVCEVAPFLQPED